MKLKANDQLHISSVKADTIAPGEEFEVSDAEGSRLIEAGLASKVAAAPKNKMAQASGNKRSGAGRAK
jgi:hypothetical protein